MKQEKKVTAAGGIVVCRGNKGIEILLIRKKGTGIWTLPKGHLEDGESLENAALREILEETGLRVRLRSKVGEISYSYQRDDLIVHETVHYFIAEPLAFKDPSPDFQEVEQAIWCPLDEVDEKLTYTNEKDLLFKLRDILQKF